MSGADNSAFVRNGDSWFSYAGPSAWARHLCQSELACLSHPGLFGVYQWHLDKVFAQEPDLKFVGTEHIADDQIICAVIPKLRRALGQRPTVSNNDLMSIQETRELDGNLFPAPRRTLDASSFGDIGGHGQ